jgi:hypothetical protein
MDFLRKNGSPNKDFCFLVNVSKLMRNYKLNYTLLSCWTHMGKVKKVYKILVGKPEGKRPFGRQRHKWEDNIKTDIRENGLQVWIGFIRLKERGQWWAV